MKISIDQACPFCGQFVAIHIDETTPPEERAQLAKGRCGCPQAVRERDIHEATIQSLHGDKIVIKNGHKCVKIKRTCRKELAL